MHRPPGAAEQQLSQIEQSAGAFTRHRGAIQEDRGASKRDRRANEGPGNAGQPLERSSENQAERTPVEDGALRRSLDQSRHQVPEATRLGTVGAAHKPRSRDSGPPAV